MSKVTKMKIEVKLSRKSIVCIKLQSLLATTDLPILRIYDVDEFDDQLWLLRNLGISCKDHPKLDKMIELTKELVNMRDDQFLEEMKDDN